MVLATIDDIKSGKVKLSNAFPRLKVIHKDCKPTLETGIATRLDLQTGEVPVDAWEWCPWALASYNNSKAEVATALSNLGFEEIQPSDKSDFYFEDQVLNPYDRRFFVAKKGNTIVISVRGTHVFEDAIADILTRHISFEYDGIKGEAHNGFLTSAKDLFQRRSARIVTLLKSNPLYSVVVTGHSLGGAVSLMLSFLLKKELKKQGLQDRKVECWTFGCPPCVSKEFVDKADFIHNVVYNDDVVPRASLRNIKIALNENADKAYLDSLDKYRKDVKTNAKEIRKTVEDKRNQFNPEGTRLVCPGYFYHLLTSTEGDSSPAYVPYVSKGLSDGLGIIVVSDTMISDHLYYKFLWPKHAAAP